jgi:hypothetical protein
MSLILWGWNLCVCEVAKDCDSNILESKGNILNFYICFFKNSHCAHMEVELHAIFVVKFEKGGLHIYKFSNPLKKNISRGCCQ